MTKKNIKIVIDILFKMYPDAECELVHSSPFELLIATVLSAQTTDKKVNQVTEKLFKLHNTPESFLEMTIEELEGTIREIGLYKSKAKHILSLCRDLLIKYDGTVPKTMEELMSLDGVGRKTANVVLSNAYNIPSIAVDTHVFRVSNRIGLATGKEVLEVEKGLMKALPKKLWVQTHHTLIFHGRRICIARKPKCGECEIKDLCEYYNASMLDAPNTPL
jgi:endonuclease III